MIDNPGKKTLTLKQSRDPLAGGILSYTRPNHATLVLDGAFAGKKIEATLRRAPLPEFYLTNRGFHWINEYPMNR